MCTVIICPCEVALGRMPVVEMACVGLYYLNHQGLRSERETHTDSPGNRIHLSKPGERVCMRVYKNTYKGIEMLL